MADEPRHETWYVVQRAPVIAAVATLATLLASVVIAAHVYDRTLQPTHLRPVQTFPAPGVDTFIHDGVNDPHRPLPAPSPTPAIEAAKRQVVHDGLAGWPR